MIQWNKYQDNRPVNSGVYLIANEDADPPLKAASYFDPVHGWSGIGHIMERVINYWAEYPQCPTTNEYAQVQSSPNCNQ